MLSIRESKLLAKRAKHALAVDISHNFANKNLV